jgi:hypothetical protein
MEPPETNPSLSNMKFKFIKARATAAVPVGPGPRQTTGLLKGAAVRACKCLTWHDNPVNAILTGSNEGNEGAFGRCSTDQAETAWGTGH